MILPIGPSVPAPPPPPEPTTTGTVQVVGPQFCQPYVVNLTVTQKKLSLTDGDFSVSDVNGNVLMKVQGHLFSLRERRVLCDPNGIPILTMKQKILSGHHRWNVFRGDSSDMKDLIFTVKKSHILQFKTNLDVFLPGNTDEKMCDFKIKGSWVARSCTFHLGNSNSIIASMHLEHTLKNVIFGKDAFGLTIYPNVDFAFVVAIIVILDEMYRDSVEM